MISRTPTRSNKEGFVYQELQLGRRETRLARGIRRSNFLSFDNPIFEGQNVNFEGIAEDTQFLEDFDIFSDTDPLSPIVEEPSKDQFDPIASTNGTLVAI